MDWAPISIFQAEGESSLTGTTNWQEDHRAGKMQLAKSVTLVPREAQQQKYWGKRPRKCTLA